MVWTLVILAAGIVAGPLPAALLILLWAYVSRTPWPSLGYVQPPIVSVALAIPGGIAFKLLMKSVVMPLLGADPINHAYAYLTGNRAAIPLMLFTILVTASFGEETFFRAWMFDRLRRLPKPAIVAITSILFGAAHYLGQGVTGVEQAAIVGAVFATIFAVTRSIVPLMVAHATFDLTAYALIYWRLETAVARAFVG